MKIEIPFLNGEETLVYTADSIAEAVRQAIENKADLSYADLSGADLSNACLNNTELRYADLNGADLSNACLNNTDLRHANFKHASLNGADLSNANLRHADLRYAYLTGAYLTGACLEDAILHRADLRYAKVQDKTLWDKRPFLSLGQCGSVNRTTLAFFFEDRSEPFIMCGCFKGGLKEFKARIKETHSGTFYEVEYNIMASHITELHKEQQQQTRKEGEVNENNG